MSQLSEWTKSWLMFALTLCSVFLVYGYQWAGGNPLTDPGVAWVSFQFALTLMLILLAHELGHYFVARHHGFQLSVPYFLPFPFAFGTLGAVIRLRSLPKSRTALLEMGAAGPIAGFLIALLAFAIGMTQTINYAQPILPEQLQEITFPDPSTIDIWMSYLGLFPLPETGKTPLMLMADPLLLKVIGGLALGEPLSPYAQLGPIAFAGWVGCLLTAINLIPVGQLDGGHILNALFPSSADKRSKILLLCALLMTIIWTGWLFWVLMIWFIGAWRSLPVPRETPLSRRSLAVSFATVIVFALCYMPRPMYIVQVDNHLIEWTPKVNTQNAQNESINDNSQGKN